MGKRSTKEIGESIRRGSLYVYHEDATYKQAGFIAPLNLDKLEYAVCQEYIATEDYFLLEVVYSLCFVTPELLYFRLKRGVSNGEHGCKVVSESGLLDSLSKLNVRLERLANLGLMFCIDAARGNDRLIRIYYLSMEGFRAFTTRLDVRRVYNRSLVYKSITEIYRHIATNIVLYSFQKNPYYKKLWTYESFDLHDGAKKVGQEDIYGRVSFKAPDSERTVQVILEPIFFKYDHKLMNAEEHASRIEKRLGVVEKIVNELTNDDTDVYVVFIAEDGEGLHKLIEIVSRQDIDFFTGRCYYTTENAIFESSYNGNDGTDSLFGMYVSDEKKLKFRQKDLPGLN